MGGEGGEGGKGGKGKDNGDDEDDKEDGCVSKTMDAREKQGPWGHGSPGGEQRRSRETRWQNDRHTPASLPEGSVHDEA